MGARKSAKPPATPEAAGTSSNGKSSEEQLTPSEVKSAKATGGKAPASNGKAPASTKKAAAAAAARRSGGKGAWASTPAWAQHVLSLGVLGAAIVATLGEYKPWEEGAQRSLLDKLRGRHSTAGQAALARPPPARPRRRLPSKSGGARFRRRSAPRR